MVVTTERDNWYITPFLSEDGRQGDEVAVEGDAEGLAASASDDVLLQQLVAQDVALEGFLDFGPILVERV